MCVVLPQSSSLSLFKNRFVFVAAAVWLVSETDIVYYTQVRGKTTALGGKNEREENWEQILL